MRIYGTSPLYNYVELVFRCKRMFVAAILLGTVITSIIVWSRSTMYEAGILVALSGDPTAALEEIASRQQQQNPELMPAKRKANRMAIWIQRTPEFLEEVVRNAQLEKKYPGKTTTELAREVRKKLTDPTLLNDMFLEVKITWPKQDEAEAILNAIFSRFQEKTMTIETLASTSRRVILEEQLKDANKEADRKSQAKVSFVTNHFWSQPNQIANNWSMHESISRDLNIARMDLAESRTRLAEVDRKLSTTEKQLTDAVESVTVNIDPTLQSKQELDALLKELNQALSVYSQEHPKVREIQKRVDLQKLQLAELQKQQPRPKEESRKIRTALNPQWQVLDSRKTELEERVRGYERRVAQLSQDLATTTQRIQSAPKGDVQFAAVEREAKQAENIRQYTENQLAAARLDEQREKMTQARSVKLEVQPKAEKVDSGAKVVFLYALGPLLGMIIAFCFSLVAESLDHTLRTPIEVERYLGKPVLAVIPKLRGMRGRKGLSGGAQATIGS